jgi:hypothetical protein
MGSVECETKLSLPNDMQNYKQYGMSTSFSFNKWPKIDNESYSFNLYPLNSTSFKSDDKLPLFFSNNNNNSTENFQYGFQVINLKCWEKLINYFKTLKSDENNSTVHFFGHISILN